MLLLLGLAVLGQGLRTWWARPESAPGGIALLPPDSSRGLAAQRQRSASLDRPLAAGETVDLDRAGVDDIARLPRIGRSLAKTIVADRSANGPFGSLEGLDRVPGVGPGLLRTIASSVRFSGIPTTPSTPSALSALSPQPLDLNSADSAALERLSGIGPYLAGKIVAYRARHGSFSSLDDLLKVGGIGPATLAKVRAGLAVR